MMTKKRKTKVVRDSDGFYFVKEHNFPRLFSLTPNLFEVKMSDLSATSTVLQFYELMMLLQRTLVGSKHQSRNLLVLLKILVDSQVKRLFSGTQRVFQQLRL
ncbi:hypothetical protein PanWU01x14_247590, partial [Parasponia andersonii]